MEKYLILSYYFFNTVDDVECEVKSHKKFLSQGDFKGRIYLAREGINGTLSAREDDAGRYMKWMEEHPVFKGIEFKIHHSDHHVFDRIAVKAKEQLVALDQEIDVSKASGHLSSQEWAEMLENRDENTILIDVRNDYESDVGHFEGAELPSIKTFREFPTYAEQLKNKVDPKNTKVMMYCTGGIRCELYSVLMNQLGFEQVYQLQGGIFKYGLEQGNRHWKGKMFVFDDRLVAPISENEEAEIISSCSFCRVSCDTYYNCANMDCNELFISCRDCVVNKKGCCTEKCLEEGRVRPFENSDHPKPFRRLPFEEKQKLGQ